MHIENLYLLCIEKPVQKQKIEEYIINNNMDSESVTRTAIKLCDNVMFSYGDYICENQKEPLPEELSTYGLVELFDILLKYGLDANLVICDDGINYKNVIQELQYIDDGDIGAKILRNILSKNGYPNFLIDGHDFFEEFDSDFIFDIQMDLYPYKWQVDVVFRFWLVLIGFGGKIKNGVCPVKTQNNFRVENFIEFENYDYKIERKSNDWTMHIFNKETQKIVATM